ncbi:VOC family protein [Microbacterium sp. GXF7504]
MITLLSHLSYVALETPDVEASVDFYVNQVGLTEVAREDDRVYLRCWGDYYAYSVVIVRGDEPALHAAGWRTTSAEALEEAVTRIEAAGVQGEWFEGRDIGRAYRFTGPWGHTLELHWDVVHHRYDDGELASTFPDRPQRRPRFAGAPRQLDHVTVCASDVDAFAQWYSDVLGFRIMARTELEEAPVSVFSVLTTNEKSHDLGVVLDGSTRAGRVNHFAFWYDTREEMLIAADLLMENGTMIEYGPTIHGIGEQSFLYYRDPSTMRIEINSGGYRNYVPDWTAQTWKTSQGSYDIYRNAGFPLSLSDSFPPADGPTATEEGVPDEIKADLLRGRV